MLLVFHVVVALASLVVAAGASVVVSRLALRASYALVGLTLASGTYLVWSTRAAMLQACMSGLAYLALAFAAIGLARHRLARAARHN